MLEYINAAHTDALGRLFFNSSEIEFEDDAFLSAIKIAGCTELTVERVNLFNTQLSVINSINAVTALLGFPEVIRSMDYIVKGISPVYIESQCTDITDQTAVIALIESIADRLYQESNLINKGVTKSALKIIIAGDIQAAHYLDVYRRHRIDSFADWEIVGSVDKRLGHKLIISLRATAYSPETTDVLSFGTHFYDKAQVVVKPDALELMVRSTHVLNLPILASIDIDQK